MAKRLHDFYRRDVITNVGGGAGVPVVYLVPAAPDSTPSPVRTDHSEATATVLIIDEPWLTDAAWVTWARELETSTIASGLRSRIFPLALEKGATAFGLRTEAVTLYEWGALDFDTRFRRLTTDLTHQFCRMLRHWLDERAVPLEPKEQHRRYREPVRLFISHTRKDANGERVAEAIRNHLHCVKDLASFFDVYDIATGLEFDTEILENIEESAVITVHTDKYSSREWCRREALAAKRHHVPLVVANCISDGDERVFPYLGNVPLVRMDPLALDRIDVVVSALLTETLRDFLWRCWVEMVRPYRRDEDVFVPRTPELLMLSEVDGTKKVVLVYPEPVIAAEEAALFESVSPLTNVLSMLQWVTVRTL